jgi:two-component system alkaline phosphatase synthesis response regulator PhoP
MRFTFGEWYLDILPKDDRPKARSGPILVIEDDPHVQRLIVVNLERQGYKVLRAETGEEGLEYLEVGLPSLIILDYTLPDMDIADALGRIKRNRETRHIPIILLTPKPHEVETYRGGWAGIDVYLTKPFNPMEMIVYVRKIFARQGSGPIDIVLET